MKKVNLLTNFLSHLYTFTINIYDTLYDIQNNNITVIQSRDVIILGQQLINKNWRSYKKTTLESTYQPSFVTKIIKNIRIGRGF